MTLLHKLAVSAAGIAMLLGASAAAKAEPTLPVRGHFIGYGVVSAATASCPDSKGNNILTQLELNTVRNFPILKIRHVLYGASAPSIYDYLFTRTGGTRKNQTGTVTLNVEGSGTVTHGNYAITFTPYDPNSFAGSVSLTIGNCAENIAFDFVRSSAD